MLPYAAFNQDRVLHRGEPHRVYGVCGDSYLQTRVIQALLAWSVDESARDFNLDQLDGESAKIPEILAACGNLPFLSDRRAVIVRRAEKIEGLGKSEDGAPKGKKAGPSPAKRLTEGLEGLPPTTVLILARTPETPEYGARPGTTRVINAALDKEIERLGLAIDCTVDARNTGMATSIVEAEAATRKIPLARNASAHLVERCGNDIALLLSELDKCSLRAGEGQPVTPAIIDEMTRRAPHETVFDLTDAIGERRAPRALTLLRELVGSGEPPELLLSLLVRHLRQLLQARAFMDANLPLDGSLLKRLPPQLAAQLPKDGRDNLAVLLQSQNWLGRRLAAQARNFTTPQLQAALEAALDVDLTFKGIEGDGGFEPKKMPEAALELFVVKLCS